MFACIAHTYYIKNIGPGVIVMMFVDPGVFDTKELAKLKIERSSFEKGNGFDGQVKLQNMAAHLHLHISPLLTTSGVHPTACRRRPRSPGVN